MPPDKLSPKKTCGPSGELLAVWHVEQFVWNHKRTKAQRHTMLIEAKSCAEAATLAGDADGTHEIQVIRRLGPILVRSSSSGARQGAESRA